MKRKILAICLLCCLLLGLFACGKQPEDAGESSPESTVSQTAAPPPPSIEGGVYADGTEAPQTQPVAQSSLISVTIPEGYTLVRISWKLDELGICDGDAFVTAAQNYDLSQNALLADVKKAKNVLFPLEGYLFPATYEFKKDSDPKAVLDKMVSTSAMRITQEMRDRAKALGYSIHDILTIASIVEKEALTADQRPLIASVLYNRLKQGMKLQCDVTVKYCTGVIGEIYPDKLDEYKYYYNTNRCKALPAGPICNPGSASIQAALYPEKTDYLFFAIDPNGAHEARFATTYAQHQKNLKEMGIPES